MSCQIKYNNDGTYDVTAPNGETSILYQDILGLPEISDEYAAVQAWTKVYTKAFKEWYGFDWEHISADKKKTLIKDGFLDENGEPVVFYRGDYAGLESFNYSDSVGKFGQGIYLTENQTQAESFAAATDKEVYPVFLSPGKYKSFKDINEFKKEVAEFNKTKYIPTEEQIKNYVDSMHENGFTIVGKGIMGREYNTPTRNNVKSIFTQGFLIKSGLLYDSLSNKEVYNEEFQEKRKADQFINEMIARLQENLGLSPEDVQMISEDEAALITVNAKNPWTHQPAFFFDGKVYFVKGRVKLDTPFHEFSHPLIKAISKDNSKLFNKIYDDLVQTPEGQQFLTEAIEEYPDLDPTHDQIKEEVIVKAMTDYAKRENLLDPASRPSNGLAGIIAKIMYAIKQILRKLSKRPVKVENLSSSTTVKDLANMLMNESWNINMDIIKDSEIVAFLNEHKERVNNLNKMADTSQPAQVKEAINRSTRLLQQNAEIYRRQIEDMLNSKQYDQLAIVLSNTTGELDTDAIARNIGRLLNNKDITAKQVLQHERLVKSKTDEERVIAAGINALEDTAEFERKNNALSLNMITIDDQVKRIKDHIKALVNEPDQKAAFRQLAFYVKQLKDWSGFLQDFDNEAVDAGLESEHPVRQDISSIQKNVDDTQRNINKIYENTLSETFSEIFSRLTEGVIKKNEKEIAKWEKALVKATSKYEIKHLERLIADAKEENERATVPKQKMLEYLTGQMGDIGFLHSQFENFISNQDPSIASFAAYIKENHFKVDAVLHSKYNEFVTELQPLLDEYGINPSQIGKFHKDFMDVDKTAKHNDETGELEEYEVWTFHNDYKNYKYTLSIMNDKIKKAKDEWLENPSSENLIKLNELNAVKDEHIKYFFKKQYVDEYYEADLELESTEIGREAKAEVNKKLEDITDFQNTHPDASEIYKDFETVEVLWRDYKQLFSLYDNHGAKKTGKDLEKAELLRANREAKRKFVKYVPIQGAFEGALKAFEIKTIAKLQNDGLKDGTPEFEEEFKKRRQQFIDRNTHVKIKDSFYETRERIFKKISAIMSQIDTGVNTDLELEAILDSLEGRKDGDGQPIATEMTEEHLKSIKDLEEQIEASKIEMVGISGLTRAEGAELTSYYEKMAASKLTKDELARFKELKNKKSKQGLNKALKGELFSLFALLNDLQRSQPTDYYIEIMDGFYRDMMKKEGHENPEPVTMDNADRFLQPAILVPLFAKDSAFEKWFKNNHILQTKFDRETGETHEVYKRTRAWSVTRPNSEEYIEKTELYDKNGEVVETIPGVPNMKFQRREVKDQYKTGYDPKTGQVTENAHYNIQGYRTPKSLDEMKVVEDKYREELEEHNKRLARVFGEAFKDGVTFDHYINHEFLRIQQEGGAQYKILEKLKKFHMDAQKGLSRNAVLGYELPRQRKDKYEYATSGALKGDAMNKGEELWSGLTQFLGKKRDDFEEGLNNEEELMLVGTDAYNETKGSKIPIRGRYNLPLNQVSRDITSSLFTYFQSAEQNRLLVEMQPIADAMRKLAENKPIEMDNINKGVIGRAQQAMYRKVGKVSSENRRKHVIDSMVEVIFEGKKLKEGHNDPTLVKLTNNALSLASHSFFAFDMTSAMKNFLGAQFQIALEGAGGKYYSYKNWHRGRPWAFKAMAQISGQIYKQEAKSLDVQIIDIFDAIQGRFEEKFGESMSRSFERDAANLTWTTSHRKWLESEATLQLFSAIMHDTMVEQKQPDGTVKEIRYINAWELDPVTNSIKLKDGIDEKWDIGNEEFNKVKLKNHEVSNLLQGAYAGFDQPLINRNVAFRLVSSLKKYFTKMFLHRYGARGVGLNPKTWFHAKSRYNLATADTHLGFYWQNMITLRRLVQSRGKHIMYMSKEEVRAFKMGILELLKLQLFGLAYFWLFGFDPDDKDKWKKLKGKSGALPTVFTDEEWSENWNIGGWLENHMLLLMMHVEAENEHFVPVPGFGLADMYQVVAGESSIAAGASYKALLDLSADILYAMTGQEKAYYKKDTGALNIQQEGQGKYWRKLYRLLGMNGKFIDPSTSLKNFYQQRERN